MTLKRILAIGAVIPVLLTAGIVGAEQGRLAMQIDGKGPVVVLESGMGEARANWQSVVKALAPCFTVVTYDRYGIGESPPPANPDAPVLAADVADTLLSVLRARDLAGPYILVGHSLGGLYVQALARNHPEAAAGLVLVDASSPIEPEGVFVSTVPPKPGTIEAVEDAGVADSMVALRDGPELPPIPLVVIAATDHGDTQEREALWQEIQKATATLSPKGRVVVVDTGHFVQKERPEIVTDAVIDVAAEIGIDVSACRQ